MVVARSTHQQFAVLITLVEAPADEGFSAEKRGPLLTDDEWQVTDLITRRWPDHRIASTLVLSHRSLGVLIESIVVKLGLKDRAEISEQRGLLNGASLGDDAGL